MSTRTFLRKLQAIAAVALFALAVLAAPAPGAAAQSADITIEVLLHTWHNNVIEAFRDGARSFERENPGIKVNITTHGGSWDEIVVRVAAGAPPNVTAVSLPNAAPWAKNNVLVPLDDLIARTTLRSEIIKPYWDIFTWNGRTVAVPGLEGGGRFGMVWNLDMVEEAGLHVTPNDAPTWEEFLANTNRLTRVDGEGNVLVAGYDPRAGQNGMMRTLFPLWDVEWLDRDTNLIQINSPVIAEALELLRDSIYQRHPGWLGTPRNYYTITLPEPGSLTATGNLGIYAPGELRTRDPNLRYVISWPPHVEAKRVQQVLGWGWGIPTGAPHQEESMRVIEYLTTNVAFRHDLNNRVGFVGIGNSFVRDLVNSIDDENLAWYLHSQSDADIVDAPVTHEFFDRATAVFRTVKDEVLLGRAPAQSALDEANRTLTAEMRQAGY